jgi:hypothetical protein
VVELRPERKVFGGRQDAVKASDTRLYWELRSIHILSGYSKDEAGYYQYTHAIAVADTPTMASAMDVPTPSQPAASMAVAEKPLHQDTG